MSRRRLGERTESEGESEGEAEDQQRLLRGDEDEERHVGTSRTIAELQQRERQTSENEPGTSQSVKRRLGTLVSGMKGLYDDIFSKDSSYKKYIRNRESTFAVEPLVESMKVPRNRESAGLKDSMKPPRLKEWLQIACFELDQKVGSAYKFADSKVVVDGYTSTSHRDRLCLGAVENHNRNPLVVPVRRQIGGGIELERKERSITLKVLSASPIFVQAPLYALSKNENASTVFRLSSGDSIEIYNEGIFTIELASRIHEKSRIYAMQSMVICRISFVKGFGAAYRRPSIMHVPCWIEIYFQDPLQAIDWELRKTDNTEEEILRSYS
ncbi:unnamed protein product, partial [Mesorhabditis belari]|uniref:MH2 domain-containing protein n=1 Tax=Mesorhabditis belari TaxID=2138241 RepID=A0AAF3J540_9BILA